MSCRPDWICGFVHVLGQPVHVEAHFLGDRQRLGLADRAVHAEQLGVERPEAVARQLVARGAGDLRRLDRARPEDGEVLEDDLEIGVVLHQLGDVGQGPFAVVAVVVEELDQRRAAVGIADVGLEGRREQRAGAVGNRLLPLDLGDFLVVLVERLDRLAQHFGVADEVIPDDRAELLLLRRREFVRRRGRKRRQRRQADRRRDEGGPVKLHGDLLARPARQAFMPQIRWRIQGECARAAIRRTPAKRSEAKRNENETGAFVSPPAGFVWRRRRNRRFRDFVRIQIVSRRFVSPRDAAAVRLAAARSLAVHDHCRRSSGSRQAIVRQVAGKRRSRAEAAARRPRRATRSDALFAVRGRRFISVGDSAIRDRDGGAPPPRGSSAHDRRLRLHQHRSRHPGENPGAGRDDARRRLRHRARRQGREPGAGGAARRGEGGAGRGLRRRFLRRRGAGAAQRRRRRPERDPHGRQADRGGVHRRRSVGRERDRRRRRRQRRGARRTARGVAVRPGRPAAAAARSA